MEEKGATINSVTVSNAYQYIYSVVVGLLVLKFLWKGFSIYVLWRDGDADNSPRDMLTGTLQAVVTVIAFPYLYNILADVTAEIAEKLMSFFGLAGSGLPTPELAGYGLVELIILCVYFVLILVMYVRLLRKGFELLILRLGIPFACMGLIDSDYGIWKSYILTLFKTLFTSVIQIVLLSASFPVISMFHPLWGIAMICTAFATPALLQQFLAPSPRGGGLSGKIHTGIMIARSFM